MRFLGVVAVTQRSTERTEHRFDIIGGLNTQKSLVVKQFLQQISMLRTCHAQEHKMVGVAQDFAMSEFSLTLVLQFQTRKIIHDMAKISIKSEKLTPFGGIFHVRELFSRYVGSVIDKELGLRCPSFGYQYSEIDSVILVSN